MNTLFCKEGTHLSELPGLSCVGHTTQAKLRDLQNEPGAVGRGWLWVYLSPFSFSSEVGADLEGQATPLTGLVLKGREIMDSEDLQSTKSFWDHSSCHTHFIYMPLKLPSSFQWPMKAGTTGWKGPISRPVITWLLTLNLYRYSIYLLVSPRTEVVNGWFGLPGDIENSRNHLLVVIT